MKKDYVNLLNNQNGNFINMLIEKNIKNPSDFETIIITIFNENKEYVLFHDYFCEGIAPFNRILDQILSSKLNISSNIFEKGLGYLWNNYLYEIYKDNFESFDPSEKYLLWETVSKYSTTTWMYNYEGNAYMEISPVYKGTFDNKLEYQDFIFSYNMILRKKISNALIHKWQAFCKKYDFS